MEEYDSINELPKPAKEVVSVIVKSIHEVGIDRGSIQVAIDDDDELGVAYITAGNHEFRSKIVFTTDGSRRMWIVPNENV